MPRGGKRPGAGRKKGSQTKRTRKTNAIAQQAAGEGVLPLTVLLEAMRSHYAAKNLDRAAELAKDAAPYVHPKRASVTVDGKVGVSLEIVEEIVDNSDPPPKA